MTLDGNTNSDLCNHFIRTGEWNIRLINEGYNAIVEKGPWNTWK